MDVHYLYSASSGNTTIVSTDTTRIVIDCGISYKRMKEANGNVDIIADAILVTHEHSDHVNSLGPVGRKTKAVIFIPELSYEKIKKNLKGCKINFLIGGESYNIGDITITAFSTRHDSLYSVGYVLEHDGKKYAHVTDTGVITTLIKETIEGADALFIESDYDMYALNEYEEYDDMLKMRISSNFGHLSNQQVVKYLINEADFKKLNWVMLGHLSKKTNSPDILNALLKIYIPQNNVSKINIFEEPILLSI